MTACEARTKTNSKYSSKVNVKHKSKTLVLSLCFCTVTPFNVFLIRVDRNL